MSAMKLFSAGWRRFWPWLQAKPLGEVDSSVSMDVEGSDDVAVAEDAETLPHNIKAELIHGRERIEGRVEKLKLLTEREILACGNVLSSIVDNVRCLIAENEQTMEDSVLRSDTLTSRFVQEMQQDLMTQDAAVQKVLSLADGIESAIDAIRRLTEYSNILALNSKIEAARMGAQGKGFAIIADHIRDLSKTLQDTSHQVTSAVDAVREGLPSVQECAQSMHERTRLFIDDVADQVKSAALQADTGSMASSRLDGVVTLSNEALSHLQFQDTLSQSLSSISHDLMLVENRVGRVFNGERDLACEEDEPVLDDGPAEAGQIMLF